MDVPGSLPTWDLPDGTEFHATERYAPSTIPNLDGMTEDRLRGWFMERWRRAYNAKLSAFDEFVRAERYYAGFHYLDPVDNRTKEVTNLCFAHVEQVWANLMEAMPTPEIVPASPLSFQQARVLNEYARWIVRATKFQQAVGLNLRAKLKYGTCIHQVVFDEHGIAWPAQVSVFDFYPDPFGRDLPELQYYFIAGPVPTRFLQAKYPHLRKQIIADGYQSPGYDVLWRPYYEEVGMSGGAMTVGATFPGFHFTRETEPVATTGTSLVPVPDGQVNPDAETTFVVMGFFRDYSKMPVKYAGEIVQRDGADESAWVRTPSYKARLEPCCPSGWRVVQMCAGNGLFLDPGTPLDPCFLGANVVIGRDYWHEGRFWGTGELRHLIPINRWINHRKSLLNNALEYESLPILMADEDAEVDLDRAAEPGEKFTKRRGSQVEWLRYQGPQSHQFELLVAEMGDFQTVGGAHDAVTGKRPVGVEAGVAIRDLQQAAMARIKGKDRQYLQEMKDLLKKLMYATGKKAKNAITFKATNGQLLQVDPELLTLEYDIEFAPGMGTALTRKDWEEKIQNLFAIGAVDAAAVLENTDVPNRDQILMRMAMAQQAQAAAEAKAAKSNPPPGEK